MTKKLVFYDGTKSGSLLWDEDTDAWNYFSGAPKDDKAEYYRIIPTLSRGIEKVALGVARVPFAIYGKGDTEVDGSAKYSNKLGWLPSPKRLFAQISRSLDLTGCAYYRKGVNPAQYVKELRYYVTASIEPQWSQDNAELLGFKRGASGRSLFIKPEEMLYFWLDDPTIENGPPSSYPVCSAMAAAGVLKNLDVFVAQYFARGAIRPMLVFMKGSPQPAERERVEAWFSKLLAGVKNAFRQKVFNADMMDVKSIGDGLDQLRDVELTTQKRQDIAQALGIPFNILFDEAANYATAQQDKLNFLDGTIIPRAEFIAEIMNEQILEAQGCHLEFQPEGMTEYQADESERSVSLKALTDAKVPLLMAMDILGYDLTDEQRAELEKEAAKPEPVPPVPPMITVNKPAQLPPGEQPAEQAQPTDQNAKMLELQRWKRKAQKAIKAGKSAAVEFESDVIPPALCGAISGALETAISADDVTNVFSSAWVGYP